jgi:hypothetical protein
MSKYYEVLPIKGNDPENGWYYVLNANREIMPRMIRVVDGKFDNTNNVLIFYYLKPLDHLPLSREQADPSVLENTLQQILDAPNPSNQQEYNSWILTAREESNRALTIYRKSKPSQSISREQAEKIWNAAVAATKDNATIDLDKIRVDFSDFDINRGKEEYFNELIKQ